MLKVCDTIECFNNQEKRRWDFHQKAVKFRYVQLVHRKETNIKIPALPDPGIYTFMSTFTYPTDKH